MRDINAYFDKVVNTLGKIRQQEIVTVSAVLRGCWGTIFIFGNGGSSATAAHFTQDINHLTSSRAICLNDNIPSLLAYGNDTDFSSIFVLQLEKVLKPGDIVMGISCSGNSANVIKALKHAKNLQNITVGLTGFTGGKVRALVDYGIHVPCNDMQICEDIHLMLTHLLVRIRQ